MGRWGLGLELRRRAGWTETTVEQTADHPARRDHHRREAGRPSAVSSSTRGLTWASGRGV
ncbi:MAG: hypothetical protein M0C28_39170 [Candidatus Moduliflexus flocculans]|nr:hypothetical protein [Candidatus Moduliflexus flocculans]